MIPVCLPRLYAIVDAEVAARHGRTPPDLAAACFDGGARLVQLRAPSVASGQLEEWCDAIVARAERYEAMVIVNDRADVARACGAAGVHVGQGDLPAAAARAILDPAAIVGLSTHTATQAAEARSQPVDYVAVGPVYPTRTKATGYAPVGIALLHAAARRPARPVVAIGGITLDRAPEVIASGAAAVAVVSDLFRGDSPAQRVRAYVDQLGDCAPASDFP